MSTKQKFLQEWWDVNLVHENEKPKIWEKYADRLKDPNLKDETALAVSWDKRWLKKRFQKGKYQRWLIDNLKYSDKSKDLNIDDFLRLAEVQNWTPEEYKEWINEYIKKNKYISPDNLPAIIDVIYKYTPVYSYEKQLDNLRLNNSIKCLDSTYEFLKKNKLYKPNIENIIKLMDIINSNFLLYNLKELERYESERNSFSSLRPYSSLSNIILQLVVRIDDVIKRKEILSGMWLSNTLKGEHRAHEIKWNMYVYIEWMGFMDIVNWNILEVDTEGKKNHIERLDRNGEIKVWDKNLINAWTDKWPLILDIDTMQPYNDIKIDGKLVTRINEYDNLWNKRVLRVSNNEGDFIIDAETFELLKVKWTDKPIHYFSSETINFSNKKWRMVNRKFFIDEETLEPIKINGTDDIITEVKEISNSERIWDRLLYVVKTKKRKKWIIVDWETWEPLKIKWTDNIIKDLNKNNKYLLWDKECYQIEDDKNKELIIDIHNLEPVSINDWIVTSKTRWYYDGKLIVTSVFSKNYLKDGKEILTVSTNDDKYNMVIIDPKTLKKLDINVTWTLS